jgi:A/G-specific adenine glycosylase
VIHVHEDARGRLFLEKREEALLGGLYGFPQTPITRKPLTVLGLVTHVYSHFKLTGHIVFHLTAARANSADWYTRDAIDALPLSKLDHKVLALVENCWLA